jgi:hypothetical protein
MDKFDHPTRGKTVVLGFRHLLMWLVWHRRTLSISEFAELTRN